MTGNNSMTRRRRPGKCSLAVLCAAGVAGLMPSTSSAAPIPGVNSVQDLINLNQGDENDGVSQGGVVVNGLRFYDFNYSNSGAGGGTPPTASQVLTQTAPGPAGTTGLRFSAPWSATGGAGEVSTIRYKVHSESALQAINQVGAAFDGDATNTAGTFAQVTEEVRNLTGITLAELSLFDDGTGPGVDNSSTTANLVPPQTDLDLSKAIRVRSSAGGTATITFVDNIFQPVPEPTALGLLSLGGLLTLRRRRTA